MPAVDENVPASQLIQAVCVSSDVWPEEQALHELALAEEIFPSGQAMQLI